MHIEATLKRTNVTKHWLNVLLALTGMGIPFLYNLCEGSCVYLKGSIFSIDLKYMGIIYMGLLVFFSLLRRNVILLLLLSLGLGAEIQLVAFQIKHLVTCYYCLAFGAVIIILFFLNFDASKKILVTICLILGFILFSIFFQ